MTHIWQTPSGALYLPITDRGDERYVEIRPSGPGWAINALNAVELPEDAVQMAAPRVLAAAYEREDAQVKLIGSLERQIDRLRVQLSAAEMTSHEFRVMYNKALLQADEKKKDEQDARIAKVANVLYDAKFGDEYEPLSTTAERIIEVLDVDD